MINGVLFKVNISSLNNQQFRDHMGWNIGLLFCDIWEIGKGFSDGSSLKNQ